MRFGNYRTVNVSLFEAHHRSHFTASSLEISLPVMAVIVPNARFRTISLESPSKGKVSSMALESAFRRKTCKPMSRALVNLFVVKTAASVDVRALAFHCRSRSDANGSGSSG